MHSDIVLYDAQSRVFVIVFQQNGARGLTQVVAGQRGAIQFVVCGAEIHAIDLHRRAAGG
jgi:hypothetical protein